MSENPLKRQRLTGSFSPASPPYHLAKPTEQTKLPIVHPNTPTSPPYMSSISQANGGSATAATAPSSEMTPPSSVNMSQQGSHPAALAVNSLPFPTPASTTGAISSGNVDSDGDAMMIDDGSEDAVKLANSQARLGLSQYRRSDHNRQGKGLRFGEKGACGDSLFKLSEMPRPMSRPHGSQNLFELYGLSKVANSVARTDPATGEKINRIRKSYEGHIKNMQIAGKPKAVKMENAIMKHLDWPDEEYHMQRVHGRSMESALTPDLTGLSANFENLLNQALPMAPGPLPTVDTQQFKTYLATDDGSKSKAGAEKKGLQPSSTAQSSAVPSPAPKPPRPERTGTKRRYNDSSFVGYSEGYADDDIAESTGGEDDGRNSFRKKRKVKV
ncbi:Rox3-domain-containing protein [Zopfia rhizophila CBS 207.26]|uniref:Mediator of RNA polymerase II transcription subunit 19 n=1 Tax=Zopfia rhizophila CBS 207.26 TaxID=1314779 RepID=A0A6A6EEQ5_9PEZI|nr:Rox3-domain-containing protein [Zopfia rhizophila CBS 207.26]